MTIFLGRFLPFLRSVLPMTSGAVEVPARGFLPWDIAAAAVWGTGSALLGYFAARDFDRILRLMHRFSIGIAALLLVLAAAGIVWAIRGRQRAAPQKKSRGRKRANLKG
jgi:membrane protein DedA with SNARE-associated domain